MQPFEFLAQRLEVGGVQLYSCSGFRNAPLIWFMPLSLFLGRKDADVKSIVAHFMCTRTAARVLSHLAENRPASSTARRGCPVPLAVLASRASAGKARCRHSGLPAGQNVRKANALDVSSHPAPPNHFASRAIPRSREVCHPAW